MNGLDFGTAIGLIKGLGSPDPAVIEGAVNDWLDDHPEATTTVQDGSITKAKLDSNLQGTVDDVADLKSQVNAVEANLGYKAINADQIAFINTVNLYNVATNRDGVYIDSAGNEQTDKPLRSTTDYIYLPAGSYWVSYDHGNVYGFGYICYYNTSKVFQSRAQLVSNTFTVANDCYVRLWGSISHIAMAMLVAGTTEPLVYIPYDNVISKQYIPIIDGERIEENSIPSRNTEFISFQNNLINHMLVQEGKIVNTSGVIVDNAGYAITDKMYLKPLTTYSYRNCSRISYFDANDGFISYAYLGEQGAGYLTGTFTTPSAFAYAIVNLYMGALYNKEWQIVEGSTLPPYKKQNLVIDGYRIYDTQDEEVDYINLIRNWDKIVADTSPAYTVDAEVAGIEDSDKNVSAIYAKYDALMSLYPNYITRTELGTNGDTSNPVTLYRYDFKVNGQYSQNPKTKIILVSGVHPEYAGIYALYHALEKIASDPKLIDLKSDLHIICMPVVNAYGVNNGTRKNHNGVDIARNFEVGWISGTSPSSETYGGPEPLSEQESQYVNAIMQDNTDAVLFMSCHNFQAAHPAENVTKDNYCIWCAASCKYMVNLGGKVIDKMTTLWNDKYSWDEQSYGWSSLDSLYGSEGDQCLKYGIIGSTVEVGAYFKKYSADVYSSFGTSRNTETYVNLIRIAMNCFNYRDKVHQYDH